MKNLFAKSLLISSVIALTLSACDSSSDKDGTPLTANEQKNYIEETSIDLLNELKPADLYDLKYLYNYANSAEYKGDVVAQQLQKSLQEMLSFKGIDPSQKIKTSNYEMIYRLSGFTGHYTENSNKEFDYTPASDLQFSFKDNYKNEYVMTLTTSGKTKEILVDEDEEEYYNDDYTAIDSIQLTKSYIAIPEVVNVVINKGKNNLLNFSLNTDLSKTNLNEENVNFSQLSTSAKISMMNYGVELSKLVYSPTSINVGLSLTKDSKNLMSLSTSISGQSIPEAAISPINIEFDMMNKVQIKGTCKDFSKLLQYNNEIDEATTEAEINTIIEKINNELNLGLYYDGKSLQQAKFSLQLVPSEYPNESEVEPILTFVDGTSYSMLNEYFTEENFKTVIDAYLSFIQRIQDFLPKE